MLQNNFRFLVMVSLLQPEAPRPLEYTVRCRGRYYLEGSKIIEWGSDNDKQNAYGKRQYGSRMYDTMVADGCEGGGRRLHRVKAMSSVN